MKEDRDLSFLAYCKNEDLKTLVDMLTHDTNGEVRISEQLTNTDAYLYCYPYRLSMMWQEIANELQRFGGNTLANLYRRNGVCYKEISAEKQKFTSMTRPIQKNWKGHFWKKSAMTPWDRWMRKNYAIWLKN